MDSIRFDDAQLVIAKPSEQPVAMIPLDAIMAVAEERGTVGAIVKGKKDGP